MSYETRVNASKIKAVDELKLSFQNSTDYIFADYRGLSVERITQLRDKLRAVNTEFHVVKNNYARIAFQQLGKSDVAHLLVGPTAVAIVKGDGAPAAKALFDLPKDWTLKIKGGLIGRSVFNSTQIEAYSKLPSREALLSSLMGTMKAPIQNLVCAVNGVASKLVRTLQAVADQKAGK
jgi:large subunit ribosomal protein L10